MSSANIHKRQLFHWIGKHIDKQLPLAQRSTMYVDALRGSLQGGLWMSPMQEELKLPRKTSYPLTRRMVCFTENRLSDCKFHSQSYGKLGLGFSKYFVLKAGGKPVSYVKHKVGDLHTKYLLEALDLVAGTPAATRLDFIAHFVKPLYEVKARSATRTRPAATGTKVPTGPAHATIRRRQFGKAMKYHAEAEWRVVWDSALQDRKSVTFRTGAVRNYLEYEVGADLMTIVLPNRAIQQAALEDPDIKAALAGAALPVNVYHLDEISEL